MRTILASLVVLSPFAANANVIILAEEVGSEVVFTYEGSVDLAGLFGPLAAANSSNLLSPTSGALLFGQNGPSMDYYGSGFQFDPFGAGPNVFATSSSGDQFSIFSGGQLGFYNGYLSNSVFAGSAVFSGSFASLGLNVGTYESFLPNDVMTLYLGTIPSQVPEPGALALLSIGLFGLGLVRRRKV